MSNIVANKDYKNSSLYTSAVSFIGGAFLKILYPPFGVIGLLLEYYAIINLGYSAWLWSPFDKLFRNLSLGCDGSYPWLKSKKKTDTSTIYRFTLPCGLSFDSFNENKDAIEQYLGKNVDIKYTYKEIQIEVFNESGKTFYEFDPNIILTGDIVFPIGYERHGRLVTCCLSTGDDNAHMLVAGTSGGGKTVLLKVILTYLITKKDVEFYLVDLKGCEFPMFDNCKQVKKVCVNTKETLDMLNEVVSIMKARYELFRKEQVKDIIDYNKKYKNKKMKHIVVVIDEFSELMEEDDCQRELERLSALSRSAGIALILASQRPDSKVISSRIKCNATVVAGLKTNTAINSRIIIDDDKLCKLRGRGHCYFRYSGEDTEIQTMFISDSTIKKLIKPFEVKKSTESKNEKDKKPTEMSDNDYKALIDNL